MNSVQTAKVVMATALYRLILRIRQVAPAQSNDTLVLSFTIWQIQSLYRLILRIRQVAPAPI